MVVALNALCALTGVLLVFLALRDVFQVVLVPRAISRRWRISAGLTWFLWTIWPRLSWRIRDESAREDFLSTFAPFTMVALLAAWAFTISVGYGLIFVTMRSQLHPQNVSFFGALYFAGTSFSIGYGDITASSGLARLVSLLAGASGLSVVAVVTAFLFSVFAAFQRREVFVVTFGARAGAPPTGVGLLAIHAYGDMMQDLPALFIQGQAWTAEVLESHLAYPILSFFRSSHDYESWIGTLGALLDAATLSLTTLDEGKHGLARIMYEVGRHLTHDFANYYGLPRGSDVGVERWEFVAARERLAQAGLKLRDEDEAWRLFSDLRSSYASALNAMALFWHIPPVQWVGDRSLIRADHIRRQMPDAMHWGALR